RTIMSNSGTTFLALLTGAAIGAGLGMLYAPDSGEETRRRLSDNARRAQDNLNKKYRETSSTLGDKARAQNGISTPGSRKPCPQQVIKLMRSWQVWKPNLMNTGSRTPNISGSIQKEVCSPR